MTLNLTLDQRLAVSSARIQGRSDRLNHKPYEPHYYRGTSYGARRIEITQRDDPAWTAYSQGWNGTADTADV